MAYERKSENKLKGDSIEAFVESMMTTFKNQMDIRNAEQETKFATAVLEQNLSLDEQLDYRKEQLKDVADDPEERKRIRLEISSLKDRVEQKKFADEYLGKLTEYQTGISSVDTVINWLETQKANTKDQTIIDNINKTLSEKRAEKFNLTKSLLTNQTEYAVKDKTEDVLNGQLDKVVSAKNKAILSGNDELASTYDLHIQALNKAKNENSIEKDIKNLAVATVTGYSSATSLLDAYNNKINSSGTTGAITVGGVTYASPKEFWTYKRDSYIADSSANGFFERINDEITTKIKLANSKNNLNNNLVSSTATEYDALASRPEFKGYEFKIATGKQNAIQSGTDLLANNILNKYTTTYDLNTAMNEINNLKTLGGNVSATETKLITSGAQVKSGQVQNILSAAETFLKNNPEATPEEAVAASVGAGAATTLSPEKLAKTSATEIASTSAKEAATGTAKETPTTTVGQQPTQQPAQQQPAAIPTPPAPTPSVAITKQLDFGMKDLQVKELQKFLNKSGFAVASQGEGSVGMETDYFGPLTQAALKKFQQAQGIVSTGDAATTGFGRLGPQTLKAIQSFKY